MNTLLSARTVLKVAALATFFLGAFIIIAPHQALLWFDGSSTGNYHFLRFLGTALVGFSVTNWLYSKFDNIEAVMPAIYGNLTSLCLAIIFDLAGLLRDTLYPLAWLILIMHVVFAAAFGYCVLHIKDNAK